MYGYIYETTNLINNNKYVGQHKSKVFDNSYYGSGICITNAVKKYGKDNFKVVILEKCSNKEDLNEKEKYYIKQLKESGQKYYNISNGGDCAGSVYDYLDDNEIIKWKNNVSKRTKEAMIEKGLINKNGLSEEMRIKISKATKGIKKSEEMKLNTLPATQ